MYIYIYIYILECSLCIYMHRGTFKLDSEVELIVKWILSHRFDHYNLSLKFITKIYRSHRAHVGHKVFTICALELSIEPKWAYSCEKSALSRGWRFLSSSRSGPLSLKVGTIWALELFIEPKWSHSCSKLALSGGWSFLSSSLDGPLSLKVATIWALELFIELK